VRTVTSLLKASVVAALVFALAWIRMPRLGSSLIIALEAFLSAGVLIAALSLIIGYPVVRLMERFRLGRIWSYASVPALVGALLAARYTPYDTGNPFAVSISPWTRGQPGIIDGVPISRADHVGSILFAAIVGASLGIAFWHFYSDSSRPNQRLERP
jgi:hypothetical protein